MIAVFVRTHSTTVLHWMYSCDHNQQLFVADLVAEIKETFDVYLQQNYLTMMKSRMKK